MPSSLSVPCLAPRALRRFQCRQWRLTSSGAVRLNHSTNMTVPPSTCAEGGASKCTVGRSMRADTICIACVMSTVGANASSIAAVVGTGAATVSTTQGSRGQRSSVGRIRLDHHLVDALPARLGPAHHQRSDRTHGAGRIAHGPFHNPALNDARPHLLFAQQLDAQPIASLRRTHGEQHAVLTPDHNRNRRSSGHHGRRCLLAETWPL